MLPAELAVDLDLDAGEAWNLMVSMLQEDPELQARVLKAFADEPQPTDLYPVPFYPPEDWYAPQADVPASMKVTVFPDGRVLGRFFEWGECVVGVSTPGDCWTPPPSMNGYENFHQSDVTVTTAAGGQKLIDVGMLVPGHSEPDSSVEASIEHYNDPTIGKVWVRAYEDEHGGYITGSLVPWATYADAALVNGSALSGHWVWRERMTIQGGDVVSAFDCIGPSMVVRPGLPLKRRVYEPTGEAHPVAANIITLDQVPEGHGCGQHRAYIGTFEGVPAMTTQPIMNGVPQTNPLTAGTVPESVKAATRYTMPSRWRRSLTNQKAAIFDATNLEHVNVLEALVSEYDSDVVIEDITGSEVQFMTGDETVWTANFTVEEDGSVTLSNVTQDGEEAPSEEPAGEEAEASVTAAVTPEDLLARVEMLESGIEMMGDRVRVLDSIVAQNEMAEINAEELTLD